MSCICNGVSFFRLRFRLYRFSLIAAEYVGEFAWMFGGSQGFRDGVHVTKEAP